MSLPIITEMKEDPLRENARGLRTARNFSIIAGSQLEAKLILATSAGIRYGTVYHDLADNVPDPRVVCTEIDVDAKVRGYPTSEFIVKATFELPDRNIAEPVAGSTPAFNWSGGSSPGPVDIDRFGTPILNSADEPFDPPVQDTMGTLVLEIEWYVAAFSISRLRTFRNALNAQDWTIPIENYVVPRWEAWMRNITRRRVGDDLIRMSADVEIREKIPFNEVDGPHTRSGFDINVADMGRRERLTGPIYVPIKAQDADGNETSETVQDPVPLDGAGARAASATIVTRHFEIKPEADFNTLFTSG